VVAPLVVEEHSSTSGTGSEEPEFRGSQPSGSSGEEQPPRTVQRKLDFRGSQQAQREHHSSRGSLPSGTGGREESSKKVSWVEEARQRL
jgi:hypothetical protein